LGMASLPSAFNASVIVAIKASNAAAASFLLRLVFYAILAISSGFVMCIYSFQILYDYATLQAVFFHEFIDGQRPVEQIAL